jgi:hypothetical protein
VRIEVSGRRWLVVVGTSIRLSAEDDEREVPNWSHAAIICGPVSGGHGQNGTVDVGSCGFLTSGLGHRFRVLGRLFELEDIG